MNSQKIFNLQQSGTSQKMWIHKKLVMFLGCSFYYTVPDGHCDMINFTPECDFDRNDCKYIISKYWKISKKYFLSRYMWLSRIDRRWDLWPNKQWTLLQFRRRRLRIWLSHSSCHPYGKRCLQSRCKHNSV